jgi:hypothetical protein
VPNGEDSDFLGSNPVDKPVRFKDDKPQVGSLWPTPGHALIREFSEEPRSIEEALKDPFGGHRTILGNVLEDLTDLGPSPLGPNDPH